MAFVSYLVTPIETPPRYGLDHEFSVDSDEFLTTITGATGVPILDGQPHRRPAQRRRVLSRHARGDRPGPGLDHDRGVHLLGRRDRTPLRRRARGQGARGHPGQDPARCGRVGHDRVARSSRRSRRAGASWPGTTAFTGTPSVSSITARIASRSIIDGRVGFTGGAGIADVWLGHAQSPEHWRDTQVRIAGPAVTPLQTGFAQNWSQTTGELLSGATYYPEHERVRADCHGADGHELAGVGRIIRAPYALSADRLRAPIDLHRQSLLHPGSGGDRHARRGDATWRGCADHGLREAQ